MCGWNAATLAGASDAVLDGVANALQLDEAERAHLVDLTRDDTCRLYRLTHRDSILAVVGGGLSIRLFAGDCCEEPGEVVAAWAACCQVSGHAGVTVRCVLASGDEVHVDVQHRDRLAAADIARIGPQELLQHLSLTHGCSKVRWSR
jgi:hypothetical protein